MTTNLHAADFIGNQKPLGGAPHVVDGYVFLPYRKDIGIYVSVCAGIDAAYWQREGSSTFSAAINGELLPKRFRFRDTAAAALVKAAKRRGQLEKTEELAHDH